MLVGIIIDISNNIITCKLLIVFEGTIFIFKIWQLLQNNSKNFQKIEQFTPDYFFDKFAHQKKKPIKFIYKIFNFFKKNPLVMFTGLVRYYEEYLEKKIQGDIRTLIIWH
jgi:hypothetical protein